MNRARPSARYLASRHAWLRLALPASDQINETKFGCGSKWFRNVIFSLTVLPVSPRAIGVVLATRRSWDQRRVLRLALAPRIPCRRNANLHGLRSWTIRPPRPVKDGTLP